MAVHFDATTLRATVGDDMYDSASALLDSVTDLEEADGGVSGVVIDETGTYPAWAGIAGRSFVGDCSGACSSDEACLHSVAVALAGIVAGARWYASAPSHTQPAGSASPSPSPAQEPGELPEHAELRRTAGALSHAELVDLVVARARTDAAFAATVRARATG